MIISIDINTIYCYNKSTPHKSEIVEGERIMRIIKRSGAEVTFDPNKIIVAVTKANESVVPSARMTPIQIKRIAEDVESAALNLNRSLSVEEIQDMVEDQIMSQRAFAVARNYITYRYNRALIRKSNTTDEQILSLI